jgi:hypothetical protein
MSINLDSESGTTRRSLARRALFWSAIALGGIVLFLLCTYAPLAFIYYCRSPVVSRNYAAELNAPLLEIPEQDRAWPIYRQILADRKAIPGDYWNTEGSNVPGAPEELEFDLNRELLPRIRAASSVPRLGYLLRDQHDPADLVWLRAEAGPYHADTRPLPPHSDNPQLMTLLFAHAEHLKYFAAMLDRDAVLAAGDGDSARLTADIESMIYIADQLREQPFLVLDLASCGILRDSIVTLGSVLRDDPNLLTRDQLHQLAARYARFADGARIRPRFDGERMTFEDVIQRIYTDDGQGNGYLYLPAMDQVGMGGGDHAANVMAPFVLVSDRHADRAEMLQAYAWGLEAAERACAAPLWEWDGTEVDSVHAKLEADKRYGVAALLMPNARSVHFRLECCQQQRDAMITVLDIVAHRAEHGEWPATLSDANSLVSGEHRLDRFDGQSLKYRLSTVGPLLYSVCTDRDDDGGQWRPEPVVEKSIDDSPEIDGDWILWGFDEVEGGAWNPID